MAVKSGAFSWQGG